MYCGRASTVMINKYFGGQLSQDRVSLYCYSNSSGDLKPPYGCGIGLFPSTFHYPLGWSLGLGNGILVGGYNGADQGILLAWDDIARQIARYIPVMVGRDVRRDNGTHWYYHLSCVGGVKKVYVSDVVEVINPDGTKIMQNVTVSNRMFYVADPLCDGMVWKPHVSLTQQQIDILRRNNVFGAGEIIEPNYLSTWVLASPTSQAIRVINPLYLLDQMPLNQ
jgi:hypothetical protein